METASHFMPRDPDEDNSVRSDILALGSALYELEHGTAPYTGLDDEEITQRFAHGTFPPVSTMKLGPLISGAWEGTFSSVTELLERGSLLFALDAEGEDSSEDIVDSKPKSNVRPKDYITTMRAMIRLSSGHYPNFSMSPRSSFAIVALASMLAVGLASRWPFRYFRID
jgi:hypothetical protein